jgi:hypothetical protein
MRQASDRKFDWIAALAFASGAAVMLPSLTVLTITVVVVLITLF